MLINYNLCADFIRKLKGNRIFEFFISAWMINFLDENVKLLLAMYNSEEVIKINFYL